MNEINKIYHEKTDRKTPTIRDQIIIKLDSLKITVKYYIPTVPNPKEIYKFKN